ncbi:MAG: DNA-methyltransferase [Thermoplasmataceae archaeon]
MNELNFQVGSTYSLNLAEPIGDEKPPVYARRKVHIPKANFDITKVHGNYYLYQRYKESKKWKHKYIRPLGQSPPRFYSPKTMNDYCEDAIHTLTKESIDLIVDDPPYGITKNFWDIEPDWCELAKVYDYVLKDNGLIYIFGKQPMLSRVLIAFSEYFDFRFEIIWNKRNNPWVSNFMPIPVHENIFVFKKKKCLAEKTKFYYRRSGSKGKPYKKRRKPEAKSATQGKYKKDYTSINNGWRFPKSVLDITSVNGKHLEYCGFSTQKPSDLLEWILSASSDVGDVILDPHAGSGSTCISSYKMGRKPIGIELDSENFKFMNHRINQIIFPKKYITKIW